MTLPSDPALCLKKREDQPDDHHGSGSLPSIRACGRANHRDLRRRFRIAFGRCVSGIKCMLAPIYRSQIQQHGLEHTLATNRGRDAEFLGCVLAFEGFSEVNDAGVVEY